VAAEPGLWLRPPDDERGRRPRGPGAADTGRRRNAVPRLAARPVARRTRIAVYALALTSFVGIVAVRGGPSLGDAYGVTAPTTALANGDLHAAAKASILPQPPGYAWLAAPFVVVLRPVLGTPTWCDGRAPTVVRPLIPWCARDQLASHRWFRSQALLGLLAWVVMVAGCVRLLRVAGAGRGLAEMLLVTALAVIPAASDGIVQTFHPQDFVAVGLSAAAMGEAMLRRWVTAGVLFGLAFLCKQFALLALVATLAAVPTGRTRVRMAGAALAAVACGLLPFIVSDPSGTWRTVTAVDAHGVGSLTTGTLVGLTRLSESTKLVIARDGPVLLAVAMSVWARCRAHDRLLEPLPLIGLATACCAGRLLCEVWFASYYLLAVSALLLVLDLAAGRIPVWSVTWIALTGVLVEQAGGLPTARWAALCAFVAALAATARGMHAVYVWTSAQPSLVPIPRPTVPV
jgi:hypothetical protein